MQSSTIPLNLQVLNVALSGNAGLIRKHMACPRGLSTVFEGPHLLTSKGKERWRKREVDANVGRCRAQLAELAPATAAVYGTLLFGGGVFAYTRTGSKGSLLGGATGGVLLATVYFLMRVPETKDLADAIGFGTAVLFAAVFGIRLASTRKLVPAGPLLGLSVAALVVFATAYLQDRV